MSNEPVVSAAVVSGTVSALLVMLVALKIIELDETQVGAIVGFVALVAPVLIALYTRSRVTPLTRPRDSDGAILSRGEPPTPALLEMDALQTEANAINETKAGE